MFNIPTRLLPARVRDHPKNAAALGATAFPLAALIGLGLLALAQSYGSIPSECLSQFVLDIPCPGCGITRSLIALLRGDVLQSLRFNPAGATVAFAVAVQSLAGLSELRLRSTQRSRLRLARITDCLMLISLLLVWTLRLAGALPPVPEI